MEDLFLNFNFPYIKRDAIKNNPNRYDYDLKRLLNVMSEDSKKDMMEGLSER